jgi:hypothetical protein
MPEMGTENTTQCAEREKKSKETFPFEQMLNGCSGRSK